ncbi:serine hydrolase [Streptomyces sp. NPDC008121]|uniref:serine hydrolase domain-containing protein n=1 Tax=Streptomyces sp. NPDC008121 TaxID=3364809 RepID=UPI0036EA48F3
MKKNNQARFAALFCATLLASLSALQTASPSGSPAPSASVSGNDIAALTPQVKQKLDRAIGEIQKKAGVPGLMVALHVPGKGNYVKSFGVSDKKTEAQFTPTMYSRIGSVTKSFTVTGLLQLAEENKVRLDDPVSKYMRGVPNGQKITLRDLADMRSGLFNYTLDEEYDKLDNSRRSFTPEQLLAYAFKHPVNFQPGKEFEYSNTNTVLIGLIIEKITKSSLREYLDKEVIAPAGLKDTFFPKGSEIPAPRIHGYTKKTADGPTVDSTFWNPSWGWAAGAVISSVNDVSKWARVLGTGSLLEAKTQAERLKGKPTGTPGFSYGLGLSNANGWVGHDGSIAGYQTLCFYLPSARATLAVVANTDIPYKGKPVSSSIGAAVTEIVSPGNFYGSRR